MCLLLPFTGLLALGRGTRVDSLTVDSLNGVFFNT